MSTEINCAWLNVNIHEIIDNFTLDVVLDPVDQKALPNIDNFNERKVSVIKKKRQKLLGIKLSHNYSMSVFVTYCRENAPQKNKS